MGSSTIITLVLFLSVFINTKAQFGGTGSSFNPFLLGEAGEDLIESFGEGGTSNLLALSAIQRQIQTLELNVRTGAIGGCESGTIGPLNALQPTSFIRFNRPFLTPPAITVALSSIAQANAALPTNFAINPTSVTTAGASVTLTDVTNNIAAAVFSYMACPSNRSPVINSNVNTGTNFNPFSTFIG